MRHLDLEEILKLLIVNAVAVAAIVVTAPAGASGNRGVTRHDRQVIQFFAHHPRLAQTPAGALVLSRLLPRVVRSLQTADPQPAHLLLWKCIAGYPGFRPGGGSGESRGDQGARNGQYAGVLQMHPDWGYGIVGDAGRYTSGQVMAAAERGYAASRFSRGWLSGQWGQTIGPCWQYA